MVCKKNKGFKTLFDLIWVVALLFCTTQALGQFTQDSVPAFDSVTVDDDVDIDSTFFSVLNRHGKTISFSRTETDSVLNYWNHIPGLAGENLYASLANTGSPAYNTYWEKFEEVGFDPGIHHLDLYRIKSDDIEFFSTGRAYTSLHYNQAPQQTKSATNLKIGRAFDKRSGVTLQYDRINDEGEFDHHKTRQTSIGAGLYYFPKPAARFFFSYLSNNFTLEENGGITDQSLLLDPTYDDRRIVPVYIQNSLTELKEREARLTSSYVLGSVKDSITNGVSILYDGRYNLFQYKYSDPDSNQSFYGIHQVHEEGQRAFVKNRVISNSLGVSIDYGKSNASRFNGTLLGRVEYRWNQYEQGDQQRDITNLILHGDYEQQLSSKLVLHAKLSLGLGDQAGDYLFRANAVLKPLDFLTIQGFLTSQLQTPTGIRSSFNSLGSEIYSNNFASTSYNTLGGKISLNEIGLYGEIRNTIATNHIYFDQTFAPQRIADAINIFQAKIGLVKKLGPFYTENHIALQTSSDARVPVPSFYSKHYLGGKWMLFKKRLQLDTGFDGVIIPNYDGYGYFPLIGQFYPVQTAIPYNYTVNGIIGLRVDQFNVYFKFENLHTIWDDTPRFYVQDHPLYDYRLRVGFRWLLRG